MFLTIIKPASFKYGVLKQFYYTQTLKTVSLLCDSFVQGKEPQHDQYFAEQFSGEFVFCFVNLGVYNISLNFE